MIRYDRVAIDIETACTVPGCKHEGHSLCAEGHSLNPWQSRITVAALVTSDDHRRVFRGPNLVEELRSELADLPDYDIVMHNGKFDWLHLARHGLELPLDKWTLDTQLMAYVSTEKIPEHWLIEYERKRQLAGKHHRKAGRHSLKTLAPYHLGVEPFWEVQDHDDDEYVLKDAEYTLRLSYVLQSQLDELGQLEFFEQRQLPWAKLLLQAEFRGVSISMPELEQKERELQGRAVELKATLDDMWADGHKAYRSKLKAELSQRYEQMAARANKPMNYGSRYWKLYEAAREKLPTGIDYDSPKQMAWLLRDFYNYDITSLEGEESTGREVLERLANEGKEDVKTYLEWRKTNKLLTAFIPTYKELTVEGVIHPVYNPDITRTGRTSSERPNMQQVPPGLRPLFKPRPGYKFVGFDMAAIEAKLIALYSEDPTLYTIIKEGISIHDHNVKVFFDLPDVPYERVKKDFANERAAAKNVGFALFYNAGANRIRIAFAQKGYHLSQEQCRYLHKRFKESYKTAMTYSQKVVEAMERGEVLVNLAGRPLKIQDPNEAYMTAFNTLIQSSASDLLLEGALRAKQEFATRGIDAHPLLFVHDFVCFEVEEERVNEAEEILKTKLINFALSNTHGAVSLEVDGGAMSQWDK